MKQGATQIFVPGFTQSGTATMEMDDDDQEMIGAQWALG